MRVWWRIAFRFHRIMALRLALRALEAVRAGDGASARRFNDRADFYRKRAEKFCARIKGRVA